MTPRTLFLAAVFFLNACGSGVKEQAVTARIAEPAETSVLSQDSRMVFLKFSDAEDGQPVAEGFLDFSEDGLTWTGRIEPALKEGTYVLHVELQQDWDASLVPVAVYETVISIDGGQDQILFDVSPADFSLGLDEDGDGLSNLKEIGGTTSPLLADTDGDGVFDGLDLFPNLSTEFGDGDADGVGDNTDNCFTIANGDQKDTDGDVRGDACDLDDDNDGVADEAEESRGTNAFLADTDGDGIGDAADNCGTTANADQVDTDGEGLGNACDTDDDGDALADASDKCPLFASADQSDSDGNGTGDVCTGDDDGDGVADDSDNCRIVANADQEDTDGDSSGNACDTDDDNDGLLDTEETAPGGDSLITNPLAADTDGDSIGDLTDKCPLANSSSQADSDGDGEGDICDFDDSDPAIVTKDAVFVSASAASDARSGARGDPVKTVAKGIQLAQAQGKSKVFVEAGTYDENVVMADGISVHGGFDFALSARSLVTVLTSKSGSTVTFSNLANAVKLEGVSVGSSSAENDYVLVSVSAASASSSNNITLEGVSLKAPSNASSLTTALSVTNASPVVVNSVIDGGDSHESKAVSLLHSPSAKFVHNTIRGGGSASASTALSSIDSAPALLDNILFTEKGNAQKVLFFADAAPSASIVCRNNLLFGIKTGVDAPKLYVDLSPASHSYTAVSQFTPLGGNYAGNVDTLVGLAGVFSDAPGGDYRLTASSPALSFGLDPATIGLTVDKDRDGGLRPQGAGRDAGAFER